VLALQQYLSCNIDLWFLFSSAAIAFSPLTSEGVYFGAAGFESGDIKLFELGLHGESGTKLKKRELWMSSLAMEMQ
jgi:hypothetical protein